MKCYFTASVVGKSHYLPNYQKIIDILQSKHITIQYQHIFNATEDSIRMTTKKERLAFLNQLENWICECDFMVVESSFPSISVGYEISLAIHRGKPVLILYSEGDPPSLFAYHYDEKIICEKYHLDNLPLIIDDFLNYAKGSGDTRFTFFITSAMASFLDKIAKSQMIPKSVYLRNLITAAMRKRSE
jgi:2'-deoxynucleoside 5'-phosphate N-hydrolase